MVQVISKNGTILAPTNRNGKVRHLLKDGAAVIVCRDPFTIRLQYEESPQTGKTGEKPE